MVVVVFVVKVTGFGYVVRKWLCLSFTTETWYVGVPLLLLASLKVKVKVTVAAKILRVCQSFIFLNSLLQNWVC